MTKVSSKPISSEKLGQYIQNLWSAFLAMNSKDDMRLFFRSMFTHTEYKMFAKRLEIARRLIEQQTYHVISRELSVSEKTINHVSNILAEKGEGFINAYEALFSLDKKTLSKVSKRQSYLERKSFPKYKGTESFSNLVEKIVNK
jgi:uncharacterized protein YerC